MGSLCAPIHAAPSPRCGLHRMDDPVLSKHGFGRKTHISRNAAEDANTAIRHHSGNPSATGALAPANSCGYVVASQRGWKSQE